MLKILKKIYVWIIRRYPIYRRFRRSVKRMMSSCKNLQSLTNDQKKEIQNYFKQTLGKKTKLYWHQYYYSMNGEFSVKYIPNDLYFGYIKNKLFDNYIVAAYDDKNLYDLFFPGTKKPKIIVKCVDMHFYDSMNRPITKREAVDICGNIDNSIIKPTYLSAGGNGVRYLRSRNGIDINLNKKVEDVFNAYGKNFNVQEAIIQHAALAKLNPSSVNTIRVVTYFRENEVVLLYAVMRIGEPGSEVDNTTDGGYSCGILPNGCLKKLAYGFNPSRVFYQTKDGVVFENYEIPSYQKVISEAKHLHYQMPRLMIIGWDFTVDVAGDPVFIEMNAPCGLHQSAAGPAFGEYTDEILRKCR